MGVCYNWLIVERLVMGWFADMKIRIPSELAANPCLMGFGLVIAFDALTPFLGPYPEAAALGPLDYSDAAQTAFYLVAALFAPKMRILLNNMGFLLLACAYASVGAALVCVAHYVQWGILALSLSLLGAIGVGAFWCFATLKFFELFSRVTTPPIFGIRANQRTANLHRRKLANVMLFPKNTNWISNYLIRKPN